MTIFGTVYIPGEQPSSDWIAWMDAGELSIYEQEAALAARDEPAVPGVPSGPDPEP